MSRLCQALTNYPLILHGQRALITLLKNPCPPVKTQRQSSAVPVDSTGFNISTSPLAPASEFLKKRLSGKYILVFTCPNGQADFLSTTHFLCRKMAQIPRNMLTMQQWFYNH